MSYTASLSEFTHTLPRRPVFLAIHLITVFQQTLNGLKESIVAHMPSQLLNGNFQYILAQQFQTVNVWDAAKE
jgi:16S rRNA C1402 (ribose-2'-O) methylase RsmI